MTAEIQEAGSTGEAVTPSDPSLLNQPTEGAPEAADATPTSLLSEGKAEGAATEPTNEEAVKWFYDEGVPGKGEMPEGFDEKFFKQYGNIMNAAKGVQDLRSKLGGFTGAPEEGYEYKVPEDLEGIVDVDKENPLYQSFIKMAEESNMSQDKFSGFVDLYLSNEALMFQRQGEAQDEQHVANLSEEVKELGDNFNDRKDQLSDWINSTMPETDAKDLMDSVVTAKEFKRLEALMRGTTQSQIPGKSAVISNAPSWEEYDRIIHHPDYKPGSPFYREAYDRVVKPYLEYSLATRAK